LLNNQLLIAQISQKTQFRDVIITEIFADPTPKIGLPEAEYLEIYNRSDEILNLENWFLSDKYKTIVLDSFLLLPKNYLILCDIKDTSFFTPFGQVLGIISFPSLNNDEDHIQLHDSIYLIDAVYYKDDWLMGKSTGGYSLELIDLEFKCSFSSNWKASTDPSGGTPGRQNSIKGTTSSEVMSIQCEEISIIDGSTLSIFFNSNLDTVRIGKPEIRVDKNVIDSSNVHWISSNNIKIHLPNPITRGNNYTIVISGMFNCFHDDIISITTEFVYPNLPLPGDLIINEILFNPFTGGSDFVEIYNSSPRLIDLQGWKFANYYYDTISNQKEISTESFILHPDQLIAFSKDKYHLVDQYPSAIAENIFEIPSIPSYNNDSSSCYLITPSGVVSDKLSYSEDYHLPYLTDLNGISLERISYHSPTSNSSNWHSASESAGSATPGAVNSQNTINQSSAKTVDLSNFYFTPNNDGILDFLTIKINTTEPGMTVNINIFNRQRKHVISLKKDFLLGTANNINWDGRNKYGRLAEYGHYLLLVELFDKNGKLKTYKLSCALVGHL